MEDKDPLTETIIGAAIEVHRLMGPGLMESIYRKCMEEELRLRGCACEPLSRVPLQYKGVTLGDDLVMDLYFPDELKVVEKLLPVHEAQLISYLKLSKTHVGLLINFNVPVLVDGLRRRVVGEKPGTT
jgi:GxxExxY protein